MKNIILASLTATALVAGLGAAGAAEPGEEQYFAQRGNFDAAAQQRVDPGLDGWNQAQNYGYSRYQGPLGFVPGLAPIFEPDDYDD